MEHLSSFDIQSRVRLVFGENSLERLGELARELPAKRALIVTDSGIVEAGHVARAITILEAAGVEAVVFAEVHENPTTEDVTRCLEVAKACRIDAFIGLGGGSSMDTAKGCNFLLTNGGEMRDYWGVNKASKPMLPLIAIPTTAGTGSECQSFALISDAQTHHKMACGDVKAAPRIALLDPVLTVSQPRGVTVCTGIDAITHAVETAVTNKRTPYSRLYSREAFRLTINTLPIVLAEPYNIAARGQMLLGAAFAGIAIEASMLGAAHSMANPLTAHYGTTHGQAVGLALPHVVRFNAQSPEVLALYHDLALYAGLANTQDSANTALEKLLFRLQETLETAGLATRLTELGVDEESIPLLAKEAAGQWTANFNPRPVSQEEFERLYGEAL
ncbi:MAG: iron-containing alcohol dehydrogenase [Armatimonadetes bacterium]|nr:iron-containing alcohol dehydrogenase [Armatimonadota bacterium]